MQIISCSVDGTSKAAQEGVATEALMPHVMVPTNSACRKCCEDDTNSVEAEEAGCNEIRYRSER